MQPQVSVYEQNEYTTVHVGYDGGESAKALFFTEPETIEEQAHQSSWKSIQDFLIARFDKYDYYGNKCPGCFLVNMYFLSFVSVAIATVLYYPAAVLISGILFVPLSVLTTDWHAGKADRELREKQRRLLNPVQEQLYKFAKDNDFAGALNYALKITGV